MHQSNNKSILLVLAAAVVLVVATLLSIPINGQTCTSTYIKEMTYADATSSKASTLICPLGFVNSFNSANNRTCLSVNEVVSNLGKDCTTATQCGGPSWITCSTTTQKCVPRKTRMLGEYCQSRETCAGSYGTLGAMTNCYNNRCSSFQVVASVDSIKGACREKAFDGEKNIMYDCAPGYVCYLDSCAKVTENGEGGKCDVFGDDRQACKAGFVCVNGACAKISYLSLGQDCTFTNTTVTCEDGLVCKKERATDANKSCLKPSLYGDYCEATADCYKLPILQMKCSKNKCIRKYSQFDGQDCEKHEDCFLNFCDPTSLKCSSTPQTCTTTKACPTASDMKCGCGGLSSATPFTGTCVQTCIGYREDFFSCAYNNGLDEITGGLSANMGAHPFDTNSTLLTQVCAKEYGNLLKCYKKTWKDSSMYDNQITTFSGLDISGDPVVPTQIVQPVIGRNLTSPSPKTSLIVNEVSSLNINWISMLLIALIGSVMIGF